MKTITLSSFSLILGCFSVVTWGQTDREIIQNHFKSTGKSIDFEIQSTSSSLASNTHHVYIRQTLQNYPVLNAVGLVTIKDQQVAFCNEQFQSSNLPTLPFEGTSELAVLKLAFQQLGWPSDDLNWVRESSKGTQYSLSSVTTEPIFVRKAYQKTNNQFVPVLETSIRPTKGENWWSLRINANTGEILFKNDWIAHCSFDACENSTHQHQLNLLMSPPPPPGADQYRVYALPIESPSHGDRTLLINPSDITHSPFGWHDDNGIIGDEYTITRGNNVWASDDIDNDDIPGYSPDGSAALNFDFAYDSLVGVQGNLDAVITNLFYMNNMMHDIYAYYGFDEASGNFQNTNYTSNGIGNDFVFADAQDGSGTNNANFGTPPDGDNPRMQMYLWTSSNVPDLLTINDPLNLQGSYAASTAGFGPPVPTTPITEDIVLVQDGGTDPTDGCDVIVNGSALNGKIALVRRGNCTFVTKVEACQNFGAVAVIVMNNQNGSPIAMGGTSNTVNIPSIMVSKLNGDAFVAGINNGDTLNGTIVNPGDLTATDSDFDNGVIAHEYGHGISNRLVGGALNTDCLFNEEQMGEGWSDWLGLMITMQPDDVGTDPRGMATYLINEPTNGNGIRPVPYSTDPNVNDYTYGNTNSSQLSMPHGIGFVWASMLWDMNWALIDQFGFDSNVKNGTGGNNIAMALVIEGMKLTACGPGFVDARDAIIQADELLYNGDHVCLLWEVFANRGLGFSADQGSPDSRSDQTEAFDIPVSCDPTQGLPNINTSDIQIYPNPSSGALTVDLSKLGKANTIIIRDLTGKIIVSRTVINTQEVFDLTDLSSGTYFIEVVAPNTTSVLKWIKK